MKGIVFNALEAMISRRFGEDYLEGVYERAGFEEDTLPFVGPATYPDQLLLDFVGAFALVSGEPADDILRRFGEFCFPKLAEIFCKTGTMPETATEMLRATEGEIHTEVRKLDPEAMPPLIHLEEQLGGRSLLRYQSERRLCPFFEGLLQGLANHYGCTVEFEKLSCMKSGADACSYSVGFGDHGRHIS